MTFLEPAILWSLPLVALPLVIHLVNQRRFQSVEWAAMMFLLSAQALSRGYTRLRRWLIMLLRMAAVAAAVLAISRPLSRGWLAAVGGDRAGTAVVVVDRSPSMLQAAGPGAESKLATARRQLAAALETLGVRRTVLIDGATGRPLELASPRALLEVPETEASATPADMPRLMQAACEELSGAKAAAGTIWICSDQRANDWQVSDVAWQAVRDTLAKLPQSVRLTLLGYTEPASTNLAVRVTEADLVPRGDGWELVLDIVVSRPAAGDAVNVPVQIELGTARTTVDVELTNTEAAVPRQTIAIDAAGLAEAGGGAGDSAAANGWGRVSIPADDNPADNDFYFSFGVPVVRRTVIVAENPQARRALELVAGIPPEKQLQSTTETVEAAAITGISLDDIALLLWQGNLPEGDAADAVSQFVARGGQVIFMPPDSPRATEFAGMAWQSWAEHSPPVQPASWRVEEGLLASTRSGAALPVGELALRRTCGITGEGTQLAVLPDGRPLVVRAATGRGGVSLVATTPAMRDSDLAANGIVLYALVQRAVDEGLQAVGIARQLDAGSERRGGSAEQVGWRQIAGPPAASTERGYHAGVYATDGRLMAVNRPASEDGAAMVPDRDVDALFQGVSFSRFEQKAGDGGMIVEEVWRLFLVGVLVALVVEGLLCLPTQHKAPAAASFGGAAA